MTIGERWKCARQPERRVLDGRYARLEPLAAHHANDLFASAVEPGAEDRFRYLFQQVPESEDDLSAWIRLVGDCDDPLFFAVIDKATGRAKGRQALMRIDTANGVIEIGHVLWGPAIARTQVATEAFHLFASHVFDVLGYRRFEWKCDDRNLPSKRAAKRFGFSFEGVFRQHMIVKGESRDTAWFSIIDREWPVLRDAIERWLAPDNFDADGRQKRALDTFRTDERGR